MYNHFEPELGLDPFYQDVALWVSLLSNLESSILESPAWSYDIFTKYIYQGTWCLPIFVLKANVSWACMYSNFCMIYVRINSSEDWTYAFSYFFIWIIICIKLSQLSSNLNYFENIILNFGDITLCRIWVSSLLHLRDCPLCWLAHGRWVFWKF